MFGRIPASLPAWVGIGLLLVAHAASPLVRQGLGWRIDLAGFSAGGFIRALSAIAGYLVAAAAAWAVVLALGARARAWLGGRGDRFEAVAAGLLAGSALALGLGLTGLLFPSVLALAGALAIAVSVESQVSSRRLRRWASALSRLETSNLRLVRGLVPGLLLLPALPWLLAAPLAPPVNVDVLEYHLGLPLRWAELGRIHAFPGNVLFNMPLGFERWAAVFAVFGLTGAIPVFYLAALGVAALAFSALLREKGSEHPVLGGWLVFGWGAALTMACESHPDVGMLLAAALAMLALGRGSTAGLGLSLALAAGAKYQGVALAASFLVVARPLRMTGIGALGCLAGSAPWLARNWLETGNPIYPFGAGWIASLHWTEWNTRVLWGSMQHASVPIRAADAGGAVLEYLTAVWRGVGTVWFSPYAGVLYAAPVVLLFRRRNLFAAKLALQALLFALIWAWPHPQFGRYLLPAAVSGLGAVLVLAAGRGRGAVSAALAMVILLEGLAFVAQFRRPHAPEERVVLGAVGRAGQSRAAFGGYWGAVEWINEFTRGRAGRVLVIGQGHGYGLAAPVVANNETGIPAQLLLLGQDPDPDRMAVRLRQANVRWVLYNPVRAYHRRAFAWGHVPGEPWLRAYAELWRARIEPVLIPARFDWTGGWYAYQVRAGGEKPVAHAWLPGAEALVHEEEALRRGEVDRDLLARQRRVMGEFGISLFQRAVEAFFVQGARDEAVRLARAAEAAGLETPGSANLLGYCLARMGRDSEARRAFERALELDPGLASARENLAEVEERLRRSRRSRSAPASRR